VSESFPLCLMEVKFEDVEYFIFNELTLFREFRPLIQSYSVLSGRPRLTDVVVVGVLSHSFCLLWLPLVHDGEFGTSK